MSGVRALAPVLALAAAGCFSHRLDTNAPGHVSLETPADLSPHEPAAPADPGDQSIAIHLGGSLALGGASQGPSFVGSVAVGAEVSVLYGLHDQSAVHALDFLFPERALGAGFGLSYYSLLLTRVFHVEFQGFLRCREAVMCGMAGGVVWEPGTATTPAAYGPQFTASVGPLFLRVAYLRGQVAPVHFGVNVGPAFTLVWSQ